MTMECRYNWMVPGAGCGRYWRVVGGLTAALELPSPASSLTGPVQPPPAISTIPQPVLADAPGAHLQPPPVLHPHLVLDNILFTSTLTISFILIKRVLIILTTCTSPKPGHQCGEIDMSIEISRNKIYRLFSEN